MLPQSKSKLGIFKTRWYPMVPDTDASANVMGTLASTTDDSMVVDA
jgi:hypothetical protein